MDNQKAEALLRELDAHLADVTTDPQQFLNTDLLERVSHESFQSKMWRVFVTDLMLMLAQAA